MSSALPVLRPWRDAAQLLAPGAHIVPFCSRGILAVFPVAAFLAWFFVASGSVWFAISFLVFPVVPRAVRSFLLRAISLVPASAHDVKPLPVP